MSTLADQLLNGTPISRKRITEADLRRKIRSARGRELVLDGVETSLLAKLIEGAERDPFDFGGSSFLNTKDLDSMEMSADADPDDSDTDIGGEIENEQEDARAEAPTHRSGAPANPAGTLIPVHQSIVAPSATPGAEEEIPASVLATLPALEPHGEEHPVELGAPAPAPVQPRRPAAPPAAQEPEVPGLPPETSTTPAPAKPQPTPEALSAAMRNIVGGGPAAVPLNEAGKPVAKGEHLDTEGWQQTMLEARRKKGTLKEGAPRKRPGMHQPALTESGDQKTSEAMRKANSLVNKL